MPEGGRAALLTSFLSPSPDRTASSHGTEKEGRPPHTWLAGSCPSRCDSISSLPCEAARSTPWAWQMGSGEDHHSPSTGPEGQQAQALPPARAANPSYHHRRKGGQVLAPDHTCLGQIASPTEPSFWTPLSLPGLTRCSGLP